MTISNICLILRSIFKLNYSEKHIQILEAAERLFASKGFDGTTVRDIADEAGVNIAMISYYFGSKEKLMEALFSQRITNVKIRIESLLKNDSLAPFQKVEILIDDYVEKIMHQQQFHKIMLCEQAVNKNSFIVNLLGEIKMRNAKVIEELIKDGQKKGAFKKKIDVVMMISTMIGTISQIMVNKSYYKEFNNMQHLSDEEFDELMKKKLRAHVRNLFKAILIYE